MPQGQHRKSRALRAVAVAGLCLAALAPTSAGALVSFEFETSYLVHPGQQVWDFCLVERDGQYNVFYHTIPQVFEPDSVTC